MKDKYLKENFEPLVLNSKNLTEVLLKLKLTNKGNSRSTLKKYIKLYDINISHFETSKDRYNRTLKKCYENHTIPLHEILISGSTYTNVSFLKKRLYRDKLKERKCELCEQDENWQGKKMSLILDHINGINSDHRIENLRIICPNCNATLPTYCRGINGIEKIKKRKILKLENKIKLSISKRKIERPPYDQLKEEVKKYGYSATGRKYGVCDNTIRKWIKFYEKFNP